MSPKIFFRHSLQMKLQLQTIAALVSTIIKTIYYWFYHIFLGHNFVCCSLSPF